MLIVYFDVIGHRKRIMYSKKIKTNRKK